MGRQTAASLVRWQWRAVLLVLGLTPWLVLRPAAEPFHLPKATFVLIVAMGLVGILVFRAAEERRFAVARTPFLPAYLTYVVAAGMVTVTSADRSISLWGEYRYFVGFLLVLAITAVVVALLRDTETARYRMVAIAIAAGAAPVTLYGLVQLAGANPFTWSGDVTGVFSTMANPNFLAGYLGVVFPLCLVVAVLGRVVPPLRVTAGVLALLIVVVTLATASFQGPVALAAGSVLPLGLLLRKRLDGRTFNAILVAGFVLVAVVGTVLAGRIWSQISEGLRERTMMWDAALTIFREAPVAGKGLSTYGIFFTPNRPPEHAQFGFVNPEQAHNVALNHLAEGGLVLFLPWLATVVVIGYLLTRGLRREEGERQLLLAGFGGTWIAYQSQALVSIDLPMTVLLQWTSAAVIAGLTGAPGAAWGWTAPKRKGGSSSHGTAVRAVTTGVILFLAWFVIVPLRADVAAASGFRTINGGDVRAGIERIEASTALAPYRATYWLLLASAREGAGDQDGALDALQEAASRDAGSSQQALAVGRFADRAGDLDLATLWYERAVTRDPFNPAVLEEAADYFDSIGEFDRAQSLQSRAEIVLGVQAEG